MTNPSRKKGTAWNTAVTNCLIADGRPHVENRALKGAYDRGDIAGIPAVVIECKNAKAINLAGWLDEANVERDNDHADLGVVWMKRRGRVDAGSGYVLMDGWTFMRLLRAAGY